MLLALILACSEVAPEKPIAPEPVVEAAPPAPAPRPTAELLTELESPSTARAALDELVARKAATELEALAASSGDIGARGWAIQGLVRLETGASTLHSIQEDPASPELVRIWAAAARVRQAPDEGALVAIEASTRQWPELERAIRIRRVELGGGA